MSRDSLTITDNRTGKTYEVPITDDTIRAIDLRQIKVQADEFGMMSYDPAFTNTALCRSKITFIDGDAGILRYRGYPIEELAERSTYLETAYLILYGELPTRSQLEDWTYHVSHHTFIHESIKKFFDGFHYDAHPMGMMISTIAGLSTFYPDAKEIFNAESRRKQTWRLIGKMPTLAAFAYRHSLGMPYVYPDRELTYAGNFLNMLFKTSELQYRPESHSRTRPGRAFHSSRRSRTKLLRQCHAQRGQFTGGSVFGRRRGHGGALRPAARRRERRGPADAAGYRFDCQHSGLHQASEVRRETPDGLRSSHLQELRSARSHHQDASPRKSSR